ncbi:MAG: hypothetical protein WAM10_07660, partial [Methylocella sp.]
MTTAEAQQAPVPLSPVTVNPPKVRQRPVVSKPTKAQLKVRTALRHKIHQTQRAQAAPTRA